MANKRSRKKHSAAFKAKVAVDAIRGVKTVPEIAKQHEVHPSQVHTWKRQALEGLTGIFADGTPVQDDQELIDALYEQVGRLQVELQWLKKNLDAPVEQRRSWIGPDDELSIRRQCELCGVNGLPPELVEDGPHPAVHDRLRRS